MSQQGSPGREEHMSGMAPRKVNLSDVIELFRDPETETKSEGYAFVWAILSEDDAFYELQVSFCSDPAAPGRKFTRKYRKYPVSTGHTATNRAGQA